jgi:Ca2+-binding RTX toxin-like protein
MEGSGRLGRSAKATAAIAAGALLALPSGAWASTVAVEDGSVVYRAARGEVNAVTMIDRVVVEEVSPLIVGPGCTPSAPILCGDPSMDGVLRLGDRDDRGEHRSSTASGFVYGGQGDDEIFSDGQTAWASGGPGADDIRVNSNGLSTGLGGNGDDSIRSGSAILEDLRGQGGNDLLVQGGGQDADLAGGPGHDRLIARGTSGATLRGEGDNDTLSSLTEGGSPLVFDGGSGNDLLLGSGHHDRLSGGSGADRIEAADADADTIFCGSGQDTVAADDLDVVGNDCEGVTVQPQPSTQG